MKGVLSCSGRYDWVNVRHRCLGLLERCSWYLSLLMS